MIHRPLLPSLTLLCLLSAPACHKKNPSAVAPLPASAGTTVSTDIPLLPIKPGNFWTYSVVSEIPANIVSPGSPARSLLTTRTRRALGKVSPGEGYPVTDCFEITTPGFSSEREFVEIHDDRILLRGVLILKNQPTKPLWYAQPIPFVTAGVKAGDEVREFHFGGDSHSRKIDVIGRESLTVPAGTYPCIRLLMAGKDGEIELRRTIWFAPGIGIVREEIIRYRRDQLILRETHELTATDVRK